MNPEHMIEVTGVPLDALVRAAYAPSTPRGLGMLHFQPGDLTDEEVGEIVARSSISSRPIRMDYVKGRACKFDVFRINERLYIKNRWFDHSDDQLRDLLRSVGVDPIKLDVARTAQDNYEKHCLDKALAFLREQGGSFSENFIETPTDMEDVMTGMYVGQDRGIITGKWSDGKLTWATAA